ncbi:MAG TPA: multidrug efflux SMR transporter [Phycisphaerae bacterium]|nr:multidrug efflux SMR transporter [Phycisphaerae bacterium]
MAWVWLVLAGVCEMIWPLGFKYTHGFTMRYWAVGITFGIMVLSLYLMSQATKGGIPIGTTYAVWTGLGAAGTVVLGMLLFHEPHDWVRLGCLTLIITGAVGLKFLSPPGEGAAVAGNSQRAT